MRWGKIADDDGDGEMCQVHISHDGMAESSCQSDAKTSKLFKLSASPHTINFAPSLKKTAEIRRDEVVDLTINHIVKCYNNELPRSVCEDHVKLHYIEMDGCSVCKEMLPEFEDWVNILQKAKIPVSYEVHNVKNADGRDLFKRGACRGTPCILEEKIKIDLDTDDEIIPENHRKRFTKISEGRIKIGNFIAAYAGLPNPYVSPIRNNTVPKNLESRRKSLLRVV